MKLSLIAAISDNNVIGRGTQIPWKLRDEQRAVKAITLGHCLIMGRRTWESIGRPLPGRTSIVVTRQDGYETGHPEAIVVASLDAALEAAERSGDDEAFVFGGVALYAEALPRADRLYLTRVHAEIDGDVFFPAFDETAWRVAHETRHAADEHNEHAFTMRRYERV